MKAIVFDCFGVLTTDTWKAFLDSLPEDVDYHAAHNLNQAFGSGFISREEFFDEVEKLTGKKPLLTEDIQISEVTKNNMLLDYISELKDRGYKIGLLSNIANNWIRDSFLTPKELGLFDEMILSYEVGMVKPDPAIFELTASRLNADLTETVLIDDIERYCSAAEDLGMKAIVYDNLKQLKIELEKII